LPGTLSEPEAKALSLTCTAYVVIGCAAMLRYASDVYDTETQLYYLQARYYDPETARFTSLDPIIGNTANPGSLNRMLMLTEIR